MSENIQLSAELREATGTRASRRLRRLQNKIPAIIYGGDKPSLMVTIDDRQMLKALKNESFYSSVLDVTVEGKTETVILKAMQRHPCNNKVLHLDWHRVSKNTKITLNVPLRITGSEIAPGVKLGGGIITQQITDVSIQCLAKDLPEAITLDISTLELDQSVHLSDLPLPERVELTADISDPNFNVPVLSIHLPHHRKDEEEETASTEEEGDEKEEKNGKNGDNGKTEENAKKK